MKRQIAKTISIASLFLVLFVGAAHVSAGICNNPTCGKGQRAVTATAPVQNREHRAASAQSGSATFTLLLVEWAINSLFLL